VSGSLVGDAGWKSKLTSKGENHVEECVSFL
jgi:hypothetical protein